MCSFQPAEGNLYYTIREFTGKTVLSFHQREPLRGKSLQSLRSIRGFGLTVVFHVYIFLLAESPPRVLFFPPIPKAWGEPPPLLFNPDSPLEGTPCLRLDPPETVEGVQDTGEQVRSETPVSAVCCHWAPGQNELSRGTTLCECYYLICTFKLIWWVLVEQFCTDELRIRSSLWIAFSNCLTLLIKSRVLAYW